MFSIILVEPKRASNVGAAARAMQTMGFKDLRIIGEPLHKNQQARALAHGSIAVLEAAQHFDNLAAAIADLDLVIGTSAKNRHQRRYHHSPGELHQLLHAKGASVNRAGLLFGREECGLSNEALSHCDLLTQVPLASPQPSLNLAQSVMVYCYSLSDLSARRESCTVDPGQYRALKPKVADLLYSAGIDKDEKAWRWAMERLAGAADEDIKFLHFICDKLQRRQEP